MRVDQSGISIHLSLAALEPAVLEPAALHRQLVQLLAHSLQIILINSRKTKLYAFAKKIYIPPSHLSGALEVADEVSGELLVVDGDEGVGCSGQSCPASPAHLPLSSALAL